MIATASRPETQAWVRELGAHHVVDHSQAAGAQIEVLGLGAQQYDGSAAAAGTYCF